MYEQLALYIDGEFIGGEGRKAENVINPANQQVLGQLPHATPGRPGPRPGGRPAGLRILEAHLAPGARRHPAQGAPNSRASAPRRSAAT